ncbi:MAG: hypothetical protein AAGA78_06045 [Pseudomonadota bacterium]
MRLSVVLLAVFALAACDEAMMEQQAASAEAETAAAAAAPEAPAQDLSPPPGLSGEEMVIWNALSDSAKADAKTFIASGGTFAEFYGG